MLCLLLSLFLFVWRVDKKTHTHTPVFLCVYAYLLVITVEFRFVVLYPLPPYYDVLPENPDPFRYPLYCNVIKCVTRNRLSAQYQYIGK